MAVPLVLAAGCERPQSILDPAGPSAHAIAQVWWGMFAVGLAVWIGVAVLWLVAMRRRGRASDEAARRSARRWIAGGGVALPVVAIVALLVFGTPAGLHQLPLRLAHGEALQVQAIGHQWWWELRYADAPGLMLRNELRVPVGRPVDVHTESRDVIHSFWVPRLGGKLDAIPGRTLVLRLRADEAGRFRGQCAEFCGTSHAHMVMTVIAMPPAEFDAWLQAQRAQDGAAR